MKNIEQFLRSYHLDKLKAKATGYIKKRRITKIYLENNLLLAQKITLNNC